MKLTIRLFTLGAVMAVASTALAQSESPAKPSNPKEFEGTFTIQPQSATAMVLEVENSGTSVGSTIATNKPNKAANQQWIFTAKGDGYYSISPANAKNLVLAVQYADTDQGTPIILETDAGKPSQLWFVEKLDDGNVALHPKHNLGNIVDNPGGGTDVGNQAKIWNIIQHPNVWWKLQPVK